MSYPELPGRAMPYHVDGTVVKIVRASAGVVHALTDTETAELNDYDYTLMPVGSGLVSDAYVVFSFPEKRHLRGAYGRWQGRNDASQWGWSAIDAIQGSNDTTNGVDGTWVDALPSDTWGAWRGNAPPFDEWRYPFAGQFPNDDAFKVWRFRFLYEVDLGYLATIHLYGHKATNETPDDIIFVDPGTGGELTLPLNFHAVPAGTTSILSFALKNASTSLTAQNISLSVDDEYDIIRIGWSDTGPWETGLTIDSLAAGATSDTVYVKAEPPAPPTPLKPHRAPVVVTVGAWS